MWNHFIPRCSLVIPCLSGSQAYFITALNMRKWPLFPWTNICNLLIGFVRKIWWRGQSTSKEHLWEIEGKIKIERGRKREESGTLRHQMVGMVSQHPGKRTEVAMCRLIASRTTSFLFFFFLAKIQIRHQNPPLISFTSFTNVCLQAHVLLCIIKTRGGRVEKYRWKDSDIAIASASSGLVIGGIRKRQRCQNSFLLILPFSQR